MTSQVITTLCVPDIYLTEERLIMLFDAFRGGLQSDDSTTSIFASLVNSVRQLYVPQIMLLQRDLLSRTVPQFAIPHDQQPATLLDQTTTQHALEVEELTKRHDSQLRQIRSERELERAALLKGIPTEWIVGIDVVYGDQEAQKPPNRVKELTGHGDGMNYSLNGKYVWLVPRMDKNPAGALTGVDIAIQDHVDNTKRSLSLGTDGKQRYLLIQSGGDADKIHTMNLLRLSHPMVGPPDGYDGSSPDINGGRKGGWLYLVWKSHSGKF